MRSHWCLRASAALRRAIGSTCSSDVMNLRAHADTSGSSGKAKCPSCERCSRACRRAIVGESDALRPERSLSVPSGTPSEVRAKPPPWPPQLPLPTGIAIPADSACSPCVCNGLRPTGLCKAERWSTWKFTSTSVPIMSDAGCADRLGSSPDHAPDSLGEAAALGEAPPERRNPWMLAPRPHGASCTEPSSCSASGARCSWVE
mmetsp:Transcript_35016/g.91966  ORF Transcript_35016/g.91966 Transcript_35016/m.91966 type:complete len:203 (-) Transcript_35016:823-1431(-)